MSHEILENSKDQIPQNDQQKKFNEKNNAMMSPSFLPRESSITQANNNSLPQSFTSTYAEVVSKEIINKAISLVFTEKYKQQIYHRLADFCSEYVYESFKPCLYQEFIAYDQCKEDEEDFNAHNNTSNSLFFNNVFVDDNTWKEIKEPPKPFLERDASTLMKHKKATEDEENKYDPKRNNPLTEITQTEPSVKEDKKQSKKVSKFNIRNKVELSARPRDNEKTLNKLKKDLNPLSLSSSNNINKNIKAKVNENTKETESESIIREYNDGVDKNKVVELETHDLPIKLFMNMRITEDQIKEYEELRKNRIIEIAKKEEEEKRSKEQEKRDYMNSMTVKHVKEIDMQRLTFDPNGKLIPLKLPKIESLGNEFWWSKQIVKDLAVFPNEIPKEKPASSPLKKDQKKANIKSTIADDKKKARNSTKNVTDLGDNIAYNLDLFSNKSSKYASLKNNIPIIPAGSNINIINPEVGVIISDGLQKKEGSMEFSTKFNKPSMEEFSRVGLESMIINHSKHRLMSSGNSNLNNRLNESNQYIGYAEKFNSSNNPLVQNAHASRNSEYGNRGDIRKNKLLTSDNPLIPNSRSQFFKSQNYESIILGKQLQTNLKTTIDLVEDTISNQNIISFDFNSNKINTELSMNINDDFIKERHGRESNHYRNPESLNLNMINAFNSKIIKSKDWGSSNLNSYQFSYHRRPVKSNHVKELGLRIVSTRLPRDRRLNSGKRINSIR